MLIVVLVIFNNFKTFFFHYYVLTPLVKSFCLSILIKYDFSEIIELWCFITGFLVSVNNEVFGGLILKTWHSKNMGCQRTKIQ